MPTTRVPKDFEDTIKRLTRDLEEAERHLVFAVVSHTTLENFSEVVDKIRGTGWAVLNSTVDQFSAGQQAGIVLTSHRVQRAVALLNHLEDEIAAGRISPSTQGAQELLTQLGVVYKKLHYFFTGKPAPLESSSTK